MNKHVISLKGPWLARTIEPGETKTCRLNIKSPDDWSVWQVEAGYSGALTLERKFNWLFPEPAPDRIELQINCRLAPQAILNGEAIQLESTNKCLSADIKHLLQSSNRLELKFQLNQWPGDTPMLERVELHSHG